MRVHSLSAVVFRSAQPERLAHFYRELLGVPFVGRSHGPTDLHQEARMGEMRFAIVPCQEPQQGVSPTFLVNGLDPCLHLLEPAGVTLQGPIQSLGDAPDWAQAAADLGYYDQSHLIHEFKELFGCTPEEARLGKFETRL